MNLIGKYKVGKLRFRWHFDFQMSTSRRDILMDSECGCGRCNKEKEKVSSPSGNKIGIWANQFRRRIVSFCREKLKPNHSWREKLDRYLERRYATFNGFQTMKRTYRPRRVRTRK
jgi:hypothetical protein